MTLLLLVDQSNILYRSYYSGRNDVVHPWRGVVRYFQLLSNCVQRIRNEAEEVEVIFAGESKTTLLRSLVDPTYKLNRKRNKETRFNDHKETILDIHKLLGLDIFSIDGLEGDDLIASVLSNIVYKEDPLKYRVFIVSNDKDLRALLSTERPSTKIYQPPGFIYTTDSFEKEYGFPPERFQFYKALVGDRSDGVSGVNGWGPVKATKHVRAGDWMLVLNEENMKESYWYSMELIRFRYCNDENVLRKIKPKGVVLTNQIKSQLLEIVEQRYKNHNAGIDTLVSVYKLSEVFR